MRCCPETVSQMLTMLRGILGPSLGTHVCWPRLAANQSAGQFKCICRLVTGAWFFASWSQAGENRLVAWGALRLPELPPETQFMAVAAGAAHVLALTDRGTVLAMGDNSRGQCIVPDGLSNVLAIAAGGYHSLALRNDGSVVGWGENRMGQATPPNGLRDVVKIAAGRNHSVAVRRDGSIVFWGDESAYQSFRGTNLAPILAAAGGGVLRPSSVSMDEFS